MREPRAENRDQRQSHSNLSSVLSLPKSDNTEKPDWIRTQPGFSYLTSVFCLLHHQNQITTAAVKTARITDKIR